MDEYERYPLSKGYRRFQTSYLPSSSQRQALKGLRWYLELVGSPQEELPEPQTPIPSLPAQVPCRAVKTAFDQPGFVNLASTSGHFSSCTSFRGRITQAAPPHGWSLCRHLAVNLGLEFSPVGQSLRGADPVKVSSAHGRCPHKRENPLGESSGVTRLTLGETRDVSCLGLSRGGPADSLGTPGQIAFLLVGLEQAAGSLRKQGQGPTCPTPAG